MKFILTSFFVKSASALIKNLPNPKISSVAFIPTAGDIYDDKWFVDEDRNKLVELGYKVEDIELTKIKKSNIAQKLAKFDIIFVAGGNIYYLLEWARKSGFESFIKSKVGSDITYIGSSAGSLLLCPTIDIARGFDDPNKAPVMKDFSGFNLVDFLVLPHYGKEKYIDKMNKIITEWEKNGYEVKTLKDSQAIVIENDGKEILVEVKKVLT